MVERDRGWNTKGHMGHGLEYKFYFKCSAKLSASIKLGGNYVSREDLIALSHVYDSFQGAFGGGGGKTREWP